MTLLSKKMDAIKPSPTIAITRLAAELRRQGREIIGLSQGEPDFDTPEHIRDAAKAAIDRGETRYTDVDGTPALKAAIVDKFRRENGIDYEISEISVGTGGKQVIANALAALLDEGDEVIIPAPYWVSYPDMVRIAGGTPVVVPCEADQGFKLDPAQLKSAITSSTKCLILNSPSNPTGAIYIERELAALAEVIEANPRLFVLADDMYEHIRYGETPFTTLAAVAPHLKSRILTCNGVSKAYSMTGWRIGFAGAPAPLIKAMATLQSQSTTNPSSISQAAAIAALTGPLEFLNERNVVFQQRRDLCVQALNAIDGITCKIPDGAFYVYPSCEGLIGRRRADGSPLQSDTDVASFLIEEAGVAVVPGSAFGLAPYFRVSFATSTEILRSACDKIAEACSKLK